MAGRSGGGTARMVSAVVSLVAIAGFSAAQAGDFYWQARRNSQWSAGASAGVSNWYSLPPLLGALRNPPGTTDTAIFARGARSYAVSISQDETPVGKIDVRAGTQYRFNVGEIDDLVVHGAGIFSRSSVAPQINLGELGTLTLKNSARFHSYTTSRAAHIFLHEESELAFEDQSLGGNAWVRNRGGSIRFLGASSAQSMTMLNESTIQAPHSRIDFRGRSTGGKANIVNQHRGTVNFTTTLGPAGDGRVSAGKIQNFGSLWIGTRKLFLSDSFVQELDGVSGELNIAIFRQHAGAIKVTTSARLGGVLRVNVIEPVAGQTYTIVTAGKARLGKFSSVETTNVTMPQPIVTYSKNGVRLHFNP